MEYGTFMTYSKVNLVNRVSGKIVCCIRCIVPDDRIIRLSPVPGTRLCSVLGFYDQKGRSRGKIFVIIYPIVQYLAHIQRTLIFKVIFYIPKGVFNVDVCYLCYTLYICCGFLLYFVKMYSI